ncbi:MAG: hypothetical protein QME74_03120 [Candidatus Edwardsbacteria bacterium]|nr:hypothetical protein [Candidatus Edwardsbacteria bacterium]
MENETIINQLPVDRTTCFSNDKEEQSDKVQKQQGKLLAKLGPFLKKFLESEERILYAVPAVAPMSALEQALKGWHVYYLKACALVFTTKRVLYMPTGMNGKPRRSLAQARYGDIAGFTLKGMLSGSFELVYKSGRKEKFTIQTMGDWKKINSFLTRYIPGGEATDRRDRHFLCPRCAKPLVKDIYACPSCRLAFKTPAQAIKFALLVPGGGFFLTGHFWFGIQGALADIVIFIFVFSAAVAAHGRAELIVGPVFMLVLLVLNKLVAVAHVKYHVGQFMPTENLT